MGYGGKLFFFKDGPYREGGKRTKLHAKQRSKKGLSNPSKKGEGEAWEDHFRREKRETILAKKRPMPTLVSQKIYQRLDPGTLKDVARREVLKGRAMRLRNRTIQALIWGFFRKM